jgi:hypothetical protein
MTQIGQPKGRTGLAEIAESLRPLQRPLADDPHLWRSPSDSVGPSVDDITGECPWQRLLVGELQFFMDGSPSQDEIPAIPTFSRVLYITKGECLTTSLEYSGFRLGKHTARSFPLPLFCGKPQLD